MESTGRNRIGTWNVHFNLGGRNAVEKMFLENFPCRFAW